MISFVVLHFIDGPRNLLSQLLCVCCIDVIENIGNFS